MGSQTGAAFLKFRIFHCQTVLFHESLASREVQDGLAIVDFGHFPFR